MVRWCWVNFQCRGVLLIWIIVRQGPIALAVGAGGVCLDIFSLVYHFSFLIPSLWETARYRLKYCLKGPLSLNATNTSERRRQTREMIDERKLSKQPPPAPTASAADHCPTQIQISRTPWHWKFTQHHRTTRPHPPMKLGMDSSKS